MSKTSTKPSTTTPKRSPGRPKKTAAKHPVKAARKSRVTVTITAPEVPASVKKLAEAKAKTLVAKPQKKPAINIDLLNKAYREAMTAAKEYESKYTKLEVEMASVKSELARTNRTVAKLKEIIEENREPKQPVESGFSLKRFLGRQR